MTGHAGQVRAVVTGAGSLEIKWPSNLRHPPNIDSNHPKYLYLIFTGPPLNIYQIFMNIPLKLVAPRCFGSSGFRHFWVTLTRNCRKFCFQQDARPVCGARPSPSRDLCLYKLVIPIIICLWHNSTPHSNSERQASATARKRQTHPARSLVLFVVYLNKNSK